MCANAIVGGGYLCPVLVELFCGCLHHIRDGLLQQVLVHAWKSIVKAKLVRDLSKTCMLRGHDTYLFEHRFHEKLSIWPLQTEILTSANRTMWL